MKSIMDPYISSTILDVKVEYQNKGKFALHYLPTTIEELISLTTCNFQINGDVFCSFNYLDNEGDLVNISNQYDYKSMKNFITEMNWKTLYLTLLVGDKKGMSLSMISQIYELGTSSLTKIESLRSEGSRLSVSNEYEIVNKLDVNEVDDIKIENFTEIKENIVEAEVKIDEIIIEAEPEAKLLKHTYTKLAKITTATNEILSKAKEIVTENAKVVHDELQKNIMKVTEQAQKVEVYDINEFVTTTLDKVKERIRNNLYTTTEAIKDVTKNAAKYVTKKAPAKKTLCKKGKPVVNSVAANILNKMAKVACTAKVMLKGKSAVKKALSPKEKLKKKVAKNIKLAVDRKLKKIRDEICGSSIKEANKLIDKIFKEEENLIFIIQKEAEEALNQEVLNKEAKPKEVHSKNNCDGCDVFPIIGSRFKCTICEDFDFCESCEESKGESHGHNFLKIRKANIVVNQMIVGVNDDNQVNRGQMIELEKEADRLIGELTKNNEKIEEKSEENLIEKNLNLNLTEKIEENFNEKTFNSDFGVKDVEIWLKHNQEKTYSLKLTNSGEKNWNNPSYLVCLDNSEDSKNKGSSIPIRVSIKKKEFTTVELVFRGDLEFGKFTSLWQMADNNNKTFGPVLMFNIHCYPKTIAKEDENLYKLLVKEMKREYGLNSIPDKHVFKAVAINKGNVEEAIPFLLNPNIDFDSL